MQKEIKNITKESFGRYGYVIEHDGSKPEGFQILFSESGTTGWRIAVSKLTRKTVVKLGKHPTSMESFEPMSGAVLICVAVTDSPEDYEVFMLDKPVCLFKDIWHATISLSECSYVKITENADVGSDGYELKKEFGAAIVNV